MLSYLNVCVCVCSFLNKKNCGFRIGVSVKQQFTEEEIYKDRDSQISAIEKTFEDAQKPVNSIMCAEIISYLLLLKYVYHVCFLLPICYTTL